MAAGAYLPLLLVISCLSFSALAFNPVWPYVLGVPSNEKPGRYGWPHTGITGAAIDSLFKSYFGINSPNSPMKTARDNIEEGSALVDKHGDPANEAEDSKCHFDDENFFNSNARLIDKKAAVVSALFENDIPLARELLGRALHTLQDFYSHSNWVELQMEDISQNLGKTWPLEIAPAAEIDPLIPTCKECIGYTRGRSLALQSADACRAALGFQDPMSPRGKLHIGACMLLVENPVCWKEAGFSNLIIAPDMSHNPPRLLTSGWFGTESKLHSHRPKGKCSHGGPFDRDADGLEGICKDTASPFYSPHSDLHEKAANLAKKASIKYIDELKDMLCTTGAGAVIAPRNCDPLRRLFGVGGPPLAFVIDTTTSMTNIIDGVRKEAVAMVMSRLGSDNEPGYFVLSEINDPAPAAARSFTKASDFIDAITRLTVYGGGVDCPEYAMTGVSNALDLLGPGGTMHVWTDAAAKDVDLAPDVAKRAAAKKIAVYTYLFNNFWCSTTEGFSLLSTGTAGQSFDNLRAADAAGTATLAGFLTQGDKVVVAVFRTDAGNLLSRRANGARSLTYDVPVDSTMGSLTLSLSATAGAAGALRLFRPDGSEALHGQPDVTSTLISSGAFYAVVSPPTGVWKVEVTAADNATGSLTLSVFGTSRVQFDKFEFVEYSGGPHEGWFPVEAPPAPGSEAIAFAALDGEFATAAFEFRGLTGKMLAAVDMVPGTGETELHMPAHLFYGLATIPNEPFNVYVSGKDTNGVAYQRMLPGRLDMTSPAHNGTVGGNSSTSTTVSSTTLTSSSTLWDNTTVTSKLYSNTSVSSTRWSSATATRTSTCNQCQYIKTDSAAPTLTQTVIYYSSSPVESSGTISYSLATKTAMMTYPCYTSCHVPPPTLSPGCPWAFPTAPVSAATGAVADAAATVDASTVVTTGKGDTAGTAYTADIATSTPRPTYEVSWSMRIEVGGVLWLSIAPALFLL